MPHAQRDHLSAEQTEGWSVLAADGPQVSDSMAASPLAMPAFMLVWIARGVLVALGLACRGHDRRTMVFAPNLLTFKEMHGEPSG